MSNYQNGRIGRAAKVARVVSSPGKKGYSALPAITRRPSVTSETSAASSSSDRLPHDEECFLTRTRSYVNRKLHWVNAVRHNDDLKDEIEDVLARLGVVNAPFDLDGSANLSMLTPGVHAALDKYDLIAFTLSDDSFDKVFNARKARNEVLQEHLNLDGPDVVYGFSIDRYCPGYSSLSYQFIPLHPHHFLVDGQPLSIDVTGNADYRQFYPTATGAILGPEEAPIGPFRAPTRTPGYARLNPLLVVLNADLKFRRYQKLNEASLTPLSSEFLNLMKRTMDFVDLVYDVPTPEPDSYGASMPSTRSVNSRHAQRPSGAYVEPRDSMNAEGEEGSPSGGGLPISNARLRLAQLRSVAYTDAASLSAFMRAAMSLERDEEWSSDDDDIMQEIQSGPPPPRTRQ